MRRILAVLCLLFIAAPAAAGHLNPMLPWQRFNDPTMLSAGRSARMAVCPKGEVMIAAFVSGTEANYVSYVMAYAPDTNRILFIFDPNPTDKNKLPTEIGFGRVDPDNNNVIPALLWIPFDLDMHADACKLLFGNDA